MSVVSMEPALAGTEVLGVERRRRWPDAVKLSILAEVGVDGQPIIDRSLPEMTIILRNGRQLRCREPICVAALEPLLSLLEAP